MITLVVVADHLAAVSFVGFLFVRPETKSAFRSLIELVAGTKTAFRSLLELVAGTKSAFRSEAQICLGKFKFISFTGRLAVCLLSFDRKFTGALKEAQVLHRW